MKTLKQRYNLLIITLLIISNLVLGFSVQAGWVSNILGGNELIPEDCRRGNQPQGACGIKELVQVGINVTRVILGVLGSFALLMFVYGGIMFLISIGNQERVQKAKSILTNAVIGILIVLSAWVIVNFIILALTAGREGIGGTGNLFNKPWDKPL
jgi:hypothetical protein